MENLKLIDGKFSPSETKEILLNMVNSKIRFHTVKDFGTEIRTGESGLRSHERISELKEIKHKIITLMEKAEKENMEVEVYATITVSCTPKK